MADAEEKPLRQSRAASLSGSAKTALLAAAVLLLASAALLSQTDTDCTTSNTTETSTAAAGSATSPPGPPSTAVLPSAPAITKTTDTTTCSAPALTSVSVVAVLLLAGLCLSPWVTKVTVGPVSADLVEPSPVSAFVQSGGGGGPGLDPASVGRARVAENFFSGAALPGAWAGATLLFMLPPPEPAVLAHRGGGGRSLDDDELNGLLVILGEVVAGAAAQPGQVAQRTEPCRADLAYAAVNVGKRVVAVVAATLETPGGSAPDDAAARGALLSLGRGWARVVIDLLALDDDSPATDG